MSETEIVPVEIQIMERLLAAQFGIPGESPAELKARAEAAVKGLWLNTVDELLFKPFEFEGKWRWNFACEIARETHRRPEDVSPREIELARNRRLMEIAAHQAVA